MNETDQEKDVSSRWLPVALGVILLVALIALGVDLAIYWRHFPGAITSENPAWGQFGDYVGGTLSPVFSLLGLLALLLTIHLQNQELTNSAREMTRSVRALEAQGAALHQQNFERTFFEMVRLHHDIVKALDLRDESGRVTTAGRDCFSVFYERFKKRHSKANASFNGQGQRKIVSEAYGEFYKATQHEIGHYFRNFHRILKFVDESEVDRKGRYTGVLRAQMSSYELALLFYNALHPVGEKVKPLVERYGILENLDLSILCNPPDEVPLFEKTAYGDQDTRTFRWSA